MKHLFLFLWILRKMWSNNLHEKLSGSSDPGGMNWKYLQGWILKFGEENIKLCITVEIFVDQLANISPPRTSYRAFMSIHLIALDKYPSVSLVCFIETWRSLFAKCVVKVKRTKAKNVCQDDQICDGLKAGIGDVYMAFKLFGTLTRAQKIQVFYLLTPKSRSTESIALECCGRFSIYGLPELVLFLIVIVNGHNFSCGMGTGGAVSHKLGRM